jgi:hypothetical protein
MHSFYRRNSAERVPNGFLQFTHEGVAKIVMKPMTSKEIIEQGIREGWIRPRLRDGAPFQNPPIDIGLEKPVLELLREDRDAEDED